MRLCDIVPLREIVLEHSPDAVSLGDALRASKGRRYFHKSEVDGLKDDIFAEAYQNLAPAQDNTVEQESAETVE